MKWASPESRHVTLLFLGEVEDNELHAVCRVVKQIAAGEPPFAMRVAGVGAFPRRGDRKSSGPASLTVRNHFGG